jgi:hypothetical protein
MRGTKRAGALVRVGVVAILGIAGCATTTNEDPFDTGLGLAGEDVLLTVQNNDARAATIYAYWNGMRERVGMVTGTKSETFRMRWRSEEVQLGYELLARRAIARQTDYVDGYRSEPIPVVRGDHLNFVIQPQG